MHLSLLYASIYWLVNISLFTNITKRTSTTFLLQVPHTDAPGRSSHIICRHGVGLGRRVFQLFKWRKFRYHVKHASKRNINCIYGVSSNATRWPRRSSITCSLVGQEKVATFFSVDSVYTVVSPANGVGYFNEVRPGGGRKLSVRRVFVVVVVVDVFVMVNNVKHNYNQQNIFIHEQAYVTVVFKSFVGCVLSTTLGY